MVLKMHKKVTALCAWVLVAAFATICSPSIAQPIVKNPSQATLRSSNGDSISFNNGALLQAGSTIVVIAPDGQQVVYTRGSSVLGGSVSEVTFSLAGSGVANARDWSSSGGITNATADGTWQVSSAGTVSHTGLFGTPPITLSIQGRTLKIAVAPASPDTLYTLWNLHQGSSEYLGYTVGQTRPATYYSDPRHDFANSVFYSPVAVPQDSDSDLFPDDVEEAFGSNVNSPTDTPINRLTSDIDGDLIPDALDDDRDGDGRVNNQDAFPDDRSEWSDSDSDGVGNNTDNCQNTSNPDQENLDGDDYGDVCDVDIDGDGILNGEDVFPRDASEWSDADSDGVGDNGDNCPSHSNSDQSDVDADGHGDQCDDDIDGDGYLNSEDDFPFDVSEWLDTDGDGIGNNTDGDLDGDGINNDVDPDQDNDGINNDDDKFDRSPYDWSDLDGDGIGDSRDPDRDGDGIVNESDEEPDSLQANCP